MKKVDLPSPSPIVSFDKWLSDIKSDISEVSKKLDNLVLKNQPDELLTIDQFCTKLDISRRTFFEWKRKGLIQYVQIGAIILIRQSDLDNFLNSHRF